MPDHDLYGLLGVSKTASQDEIKSAFRKLAKECHPDMHQGESKKGAEEKFKKVAEAYKILSEPDTRQKYDAYGYDGLKSRGGYSGGFEGYDMNDIFSGFSDIFGDLFGFETGGSSRSRGGKRRVHGEDIRYDTAINFEEAAADRKETIEISRKEPCETCHGEGIKPGTSRKVCTTCGGNGKVRQSSGFFSMVTTCPTCRGEGQIAEAHCETCGGKGIKSKKRKIEIKVPAGVTPGSYLKLTGEGHTGLHGGEDGDLYVVINIRPHEIFEREADDVILKLPVTLTQAALGEEVEIPTLYGNHKLDIPAGIQHGDTMVIKGKGFPHLHESSKGDMHIIAEIEVPRGLNSKLKDALKNVKLLETEDVYPQARKMNKNMKKYKK